MVAAFFGAFATTTSSAGQDEFDRAPIRYSDTTPDDDIARLQQRIDAGAATLRHDEHHGYLRSLLDLLAIPPSSQCLVFSKTSFQLHLIHPRSPRALYFNDDVYVGWIPGTEVIEISAVDPQLGAVFYTLGQEPSEHPRFIRDRGNCLACHATSRTRNVPGHLLRSVYTAPSGIPRFGAGTFNTTPSSPLSERWGGWYVTGSHGSQRHLGNVLSLDEDHPEQVDVESGANQAELPRLIRPDRYLTGSSDIVAQLVLAHQTDVHNRIAKASFETRIALDHVATMNEALDRASDYRDETTERRIDRVVDDLLDGLLFVDEAPLADVVSGGSGFAEEFSARGPRDHAGRSLRDFDLAEHVFRHRCSFLVYSRAFDSLPEVVLDRIYRGLWEALQGVDGERRCADWTVEERLALIEILQETKSNLPDYWRASTSG